jgi:histidinol-phosphate aminotransferase
LTSEGQPSRAPAPPRPAASLDGGSASADDLLDFSWNVNPFGSPESSLRAAARALRHSHLYPPADLPELRAALAEWHGIPADSLAFGAGVDELIKLAVHAWARRGDEAVTPVPTFGRYGIELVEHGVVVRAVRSPDPWQISVEALEDALRSPRVVIAFLCLPNNPTGAMVPAGEVGRLAAAFPHVQFVIDEAMIYPPEPGLIPLALERSNVAVLRTFSKYFGLAGLRVGYVVAQPERLAAVERARPPFNVSPVASAAAVAALDDTAFLERCRDLIHDEVEHFTSRLQELAPFTVVSAVCNVVMIRLHGMRASTLIEALTARGLAVRSGCAFAGLEHIESIRVSLLTRTANDRLADALSELVEAEEVV